MTNPGLKYDAAANYKRNAEELRLAKNELRLARAVIHDLVWNSSVTITDHPRLREALKAWGEADKLERLD